MDSLGVHRPRNVDWKRAEEALARAQVRVQVAAKAGTASAAAASH